MAISLACEAGHVAVDPTAGVKDPAERRSEGFVAWMEEDIEAYQERYPLGTKERVWLDVLLYTGLRRGDAVRLGRQHVGRDGIARQRAPGEGSRQVDGSTPGKSRLVP
jgi:integrase